MTAIPRRLLLSLLVALVALALPARGGSPTGPIEPDPFFPDGTDYGHYVPNVPGTANGRYYIGEYLGDANCHFRYDVPAGKTVIKDGVFLIGDPDNRLQTIGAIALVMGDKFIRYVTKREFSRVDAQGHPCASDDLSAAQAAPAAPAIQSIPISVEADSFAITCDGRYAVVVGSGSATPVSLVDFQTRAEVDTFAADSNVTFAATFDDGESVVIVANIPPLNDTNRLRRLKIVNGELVDTGESLAAVSQDHPDYRFQKVFAVPGSKVGVATAQFGVPQVVTFSIPGLQVLDSIAVGGDSAVVSCAGDQVWLRNGSQINGYTLDPVTGALGDTPFLTISDVGQTDAFVTNFGNALAISRDGTRLIVPEGTSFPNSPATPRTTFFDTTTGARVGFFDAFGGGSPTLVATYSCCADFPVQSMSTVLFKKGDAAPGAGGGIGKPPADALLSSFGVPAIDAFGQPAFTAKWTSATAGKGSGLFTDTASVAVVGGAVPGLGGPTFKTFTDPLIDGGHVAFLATLAGVPKPTSSAVLSDALNGSLAVIARTGSEAPGADGATFKSFSAIGLDGTSVGFLAKLSSPKATDLGLWATDATHALTLLLREGQTIGSQTIKTIASFKVGNGSQGQGRGWLLAPAAGTQALALVTFTGNDKAQAVIAAGIDGAITVLSQSGSGGTGGPDVAGANFASYGVPALNAAGHSAFLGTLATGASGVTKANARGVFANFGTTLYAPIARIGGSAGATGAKFATLKDPVLASDDSLAFTATIKGGGIHGRATKTLWAQAPSGATYLAAQGGANPPGTPGSAQWNAFTSLAVIPGHGPLFTATLVPGKGGVKENTASGVWAADADGLLHLYFRTGQTIDGKKLKSFKLLNATPGTLGATRSFNDTAQVAWLATFTDKTTAIVTTALPEAP